MYKSIDIKSKEYPIRLKEIDKVPKKLFYRGEWDMSLFESCLAVVGSRRVTRYGKEVTKEMVSDIAQHNITIVSGFMFGIDALAHEAALNGGGRTIAVMPCGIDMIHPAHQSELYHRIIEEGGLIISEYEEKVVPKQWTFVQRNRIVSGLSQATLVIEGGLKSGTLVTAQLAKKQKRQLCAIPGAINSKQSAAPNSLIKDGAIVVTSAADILDLYDKKDIKKKNIKHKQNNNLIIKELQSEAIEIDVLARRLGKTAQDITAEIMILQVQGLVEEENGKLYLK